MQKILKFLPLILLLILIVWIPLYYFLGVDPFFISGLIRSKLTPVQKEIKFNFPSEISDSHGKLTGFKTNIFADNLTKITTMAVQNSVFYAATLDGEIFSLIDTDNDGIADSRTIFYSGLKNPLGILPIENSLLVAQSGKITLLTDSRSTGVANQAKDIITGLPVGKHQTDSLALGPDGFLYISQGSTSDRGEFGIKPMEASILRSRLDGTNLQVYASGLRNPYGIAFHPVTHELFATDNGQDFPSFGVPDELNVIQPNGNYGWPNCWGNNQGNNCQENSLKPIATLGEHTSADGLAFYTGSQFPDIYKNNIFIAEYGANNQDPTIGKKVVRVSLTKNGNRYETKVEDFATGFDRPIAVATGPDGCLYVADYGKGEIDRICAVYK